VGRRWRTKPPPGWCWIGLQAGRQQAREIAVRSRSAPDAGSGDVGGRDLRLEMALCRLERPEPSGQHNGDGMIEVARLRHLLAGQPLRASASSWSGQTAICFLGPLRPGFPWWWER
jgi:hypothetical protein